MPRSLHRLRRQRRRSPIRAAALLLVMLTVAPSTSAQEPLVPAERVRAEQQGLVAMTAAGLEVSADLRAGYLAGHKLLVKVGVRNPTADAVGFPDLEQRPHLVRFQLVSASGKKQLRYTTPPPAGRDTAEDWSLSPGTARQVALELPSGGALAAGEYQITVFVEHGEESTSLGPVDVTLERPHPTAAHVAQDGEGHHQLGWATPWMHQGNQGAQLYLHSLSADDPGARGLNWHLYAFGDAEIQPQLSSCRPVDTTTRYLYYRTGDHQLGFVRLQDYGLRREPRLVGLPYPRWDLLAQGGTDANGGLNVPIRVPAPAGTRGEVRVASIDVRGRPFLRKVVALEARPLASSWTDGAGQLRILLLHDGKLDLYTLDTKAETTLPASGRRLMPQVIQAAVPTIVPVAVPVADPADKAGAALPTTLPADGGVKPPVPDDIGPGEPRADLAPMAEPASPDLQAAPPEGARGGLFGGMLDRFVQERLDLYQPPQVIGAQFAHLPDTAAQAGGTAVFTWAAAPHADTPLLVGFWLSMAGRVIDTVPGVILPAGHRLAQVLPNGYQPFYLLSMDRRGHGWVHHAGWSQPVSVGPVGPYDALRLDDEGQAWMMVLADGVGPGARLVRGSPRP